MIVKYNHILTLYFLLVLTISFSSSTLTTQITTTTTTIQQHEQNNHLKSIQNDIKALQNDEKEYTEDDVDLNFDLLLHPTAQDYDFRSYYQGEIAITTEIPYSTSLWTLEISAVGLSDKDSAKKHFQTLTGSLTPWSQYFNSDPTCHNSAPSSAKDMIFRCNKQAFREMSAFGGSFKWQNTKNGYSKQVKQVMFTMTVELEVPTQSDSIIKKVSVTRDLNLLPEGGVVNHINIDSLGDSNYMLTTSFKSMQSFNSFALRPLGAMGWVDLGNTLQCTVNGMKTTSAYTHFPSQPTTRKPSISSVYLFSVQPLQGLYGGANIPYASLTQAQIFAFAANTQITLRCTFSHQYNFYTTGVPFGLSVQMGNFGTSSEFDETQTDRIQKLTQLGPLWFIPRITASSNSPVTKELQPLGVYYSGVTPHYNGERLQSSTAEITVTYDLKPLDGRILTCEGNNKDVNINAFRLLVMIDENETFTVKGGRFIMYGTPIETTPTSSIELTSSGILTHPKRSSSTPAMIDNQLLFDGIDFCSIVQHKNFDQNYPLRVVFQFSTEFTPKHAEDTEPYRYISEYTTPGNKSPWTTNVVVVLKQVQPIDDYSAQSYQSTSITWSSAYQLLGSDAKKYPLFNIDLERMKQHEKKMEQHPFTFSVEINPLSMEHEFLMFWFSSGTWQFVLDVHDDEDKSQQQKQLLCDLYSTDDNFNIDEHHRESILPYLLHYHYQNDALIFNYKFKSNQHYLIQCDHVIYIDNVLPWVDHTQTTSQHSMSIFAIPQEISLSQFLVEKISPTITKEILINKIIEGYLSDFRYKPTTTPVNFVTNNNIVNNNTLQTDDEPEPVPDELPVFTPKHTSITTNIHYTQVPLHFPRAPINPLIIVAIVAVILVLLLAIAFGLWWWKRRQNENRKSALMEYYNYNDSVKEYIN